MNGKLSGLRVGLLDKRTVKNDEQINQWTNKMIKTGF